MEPKITIGQKSDSLKTKYYINFYVENDSEEFVNQIARNFYKTWLTTEVWRKNED